jgi:lipoprotein-releasing system permease protein
MKFELFVAKRSFGRDEKNENISQKLVRIAIFGIALCITVMIISISVLVGFKTEIRDKIIGFGSHIQIVNYDSNTSFETVTPIEENSQITQQVKEIAGIKHIQPFAIKAGIIKTDNEIQGIVMKGIDSHYDWSFFKRTMVEGSAFQVTDTATTNKVVISNYLSRILKLKVNDQFTAYFVQDPPRARRFVVSGIYKTDVDEIDKTFIICDISHIQKLNNWAKNQISGYEVSLNNFNHLDETKNKIAEIVSYTTLDQNYVLKVESIKEKYPQIFDWLNLMDMNVIVILILMLAVSGFNMIAGLIIIILDRTNMIGIFKALGVSNKSIRTIFLLQSINLIFKGLLYGNIIGIGICLIQQHFGIIRLDPTSYYVDHVPILLNIGYLIILNLGAAIVTFIMLIVPSNIISRLSPAETIKFN